MLNCVFNERDIEIYILATGIPCVIAVYNSSQRTSRILGYDVTKTKAFIDEAHKEIISLTKNGKVTTLTLFRFSCSDELNNL